MIARLPDSVVINIRDVPAVADALEKAAALERAAADFIAWWDADSVDDSIDDHLEPLRAALRVEGRATGGPMSPDWNKDGTAIVGETGAER